MPEPVAPVAEEVKEPVVTPDPAVPEDTEQDEWDSAQKDLFPGSPDKKKEEEEAKPEEVAKEPEPPVEEPTVISSPADIRMAQRQSSEEFEAVKSDVRSALLADTPTSLKDADGDPINGPEDLMKLLDPNTLPGQPGFNPDNPQGSPFTPERASLAYVTMKQQLADTVSKAESYADQVARVNVNINDESAVIIKKYDDVFKANPGLSEKLWAEYSKTLTVSGEGDKRVITAAPVSLLNYYNSVLEPYAKMMKVEAEAAAIKEEAEKVARSQTRSDRSDIYGAGKTDTRDDDEKEWDQAARELYNK
jgi:hypothetical protein